MVWMLSSTGVYTDLHDFGGPIINSDGTMGPDGILPTAITIDSAGNLYGVAAGGPYGQKTGTNAGVLWEITSAGFYVDLYDFGAPILSANGTSEPGGNTPYGVTVDRSGNLDGVTTGGGAISPVEEGSGIVWNITSCETQSVAVAPGTVVGGVAATGTVTLTKAAPAGGLLVDLATNSSAAGVPAFVLVPPGATSAKFPVHTSAVSSTTTVGIAAFVNESWAQASLNISPPSLAAVAFSPSSLTGGASSTGVVTLNGPAPAGGETITLSSSSSAVTAPPSVKIPAGSSSASFTLKTNPVASATVATITLKLGTVSLKGTLTVEPPVLASVTLASSAIVGGTEATGVIAISAEAPAGGLIVSLSANSGSVSVPATVTVPAGKEFVSFTLNSVAVAANTPVTVSAKLASVTKTATITLSAPTITSISLSPTSVVGGASSTGEVALSSAAPSAGLVITLSSGSSSATVPASVKIAAGAKTGTFTVTTKKVTAQTTAMITAKNGASLQTATLTIKP